MPIYRHSIIFFRYIADPTSYPPSHLMVINIQQKVTLPKILWNRSHITRKDQSFKLIHPGFPDSNLNYCTTDFKRQIILWQMIGKTKLKSEKILARSIMSQLQRSINLLAEPCEFPLKCDSSNWPITLSRVYNINMQYPSWSSVHFTCVLHRWESKMKYSLSLA